MDKFKAKLVAKGYNHTLGIDYHESFSPFARVVTVRFLLALVAAKSWKVHQVDVKNSYLHGFLDEEIYLIPPEGYEHANSNQVCKLSKSLYGLKQAGRQWHKELSNAL